MLASSLVTLVLSLTALVASGRWIVRLLGNITRALGLSEFSAAFVFLAVATSIPELFVGISSAWQGAGDIVIAVALGSNIVNMTLIVGLAALLSAGISTGGLNLRRDIALGIGVNLLPILFLLNGVVSRLEGAILVAFFFGYLYMLYADQRRQNGTRMPQHIMRGASSIVLMLALVIVLIIAADKTVDSSVGLASHLQVPSFLIGLFVLAVGTSLPELTTTLQSAYQRKGALALGNILGSNVADSALIVGAAALVRPLHVPLGGSIIVTSIFVIIATGALGYMAFSRSKISMSEGLLLLLCFFLFSGLLILVNAPLAV